MKNKSSLERITNILYEGCRIMLLSAMASSGCGQTKLPGYMAPLPSTICNDLEPKWSPVNDPSNKSYNLIAFRNITGLYVVSAEGGVPEQLVGGDVRNTYWSPDGTKICYTQYSERKNEIYVVDVLTKKIAQLTKTNTLNTPVGWKDNNTILFYGGALYELPAGLSTPITSLEQATKSDEIKEMLQKNETWWGDKILAVEEGDIYIEYPDGAKERLTKDNYRDRDPSGSPDGKRLVFSSSRGYPGKSGRKKNFDLFVFDCQKYGNHKEREKNMKLKNYSEGRK